MNGFAGGLVGGAIVRLFLDPTQFNTAFKQAELNAKKSTTSMEGSFSRVGVAANAAFMYATAATIAFVAAGVKAAVDYERAFQRIDAISNATTADLSRWKDELLGISRETAIPANELAEALYFLSSAGLNAAQVMPVLEASARAAAVGLGSTADVARITAQALNAYAGSGLTATQVIDTLVAAVREGSAEPEAFAEALGNVLSTAARAGVGFDEVTASLAALSNVGVDVNEGVTALNSLLMATTAPTARAAGAMKELGISTEDLRTVLREDGVLGALKLLEARTGGNLDALKKIIPNVRALKAALGLTGQESAKVSEIFRQTLESTGSLSAAFEQTMKGPAAQLQKSFNDLALAGLEIGLKLVPALVTLGKVLGVVGDNFGLLLTLLIGFKATAWLPGLFNGMATGLANMGAGGAAAATGLRAAATMTVTLGEALHAALPELMLIVAAYMAFKALIPTQEEALADIATRGAERIRAAGDDAKAVGDAIDEQVREYMRQKYGRSSAFISDQEKARRKAEADAYRESIVQQQMAAEVAATSATDFAQQNKTSLRSIEPIARLIGVSYGDMAADIKAALGDTEDREKAWAEFTAKTMADARQAIEDWRNATASSLNFVDDAFASMASEGEGSIAKIIENMKKALTTQIAFNDNLETIADRAREYGVDASSILQTFIDQGPAAADTVAAFARTGKDSFLEVIDLQNQAASNASGTARSIQDQVVGTLQQIADILAQIARHFGITIDVTVNDVDLKNLLAELKAAGVDTTTAYRVARAAYSFGSGYGLATGGVIAAANGIVSSPTYLVGEGSYSTRFGTGAELVQPLNDRMLERLGSAIGAYTVKVQGGVGGNSTTIVNVDAGLTSPLDIAQNIDWWRRTQGR